MLGLPFLSLLIFLPLFGAFVLLFMSDGGSDHAIKNAKHVSLVASVVTFFVSILIILDFDFTYDSYQFVEEYVWSEDLKIYYHLGIDGISLPFILLTTFLTPLCLLSSWKSIKNRVREYLSVFLILESFLLGSFCSLDLFLFYFFFEAALIPLFLIIGIWGREHRIYAAFKFFLYSLIGSVVLLLAFLTIYLEAGHADISVLNLHGMTIIRQLFLSGAIIFAFAIKVPMWPLHTWLPDAHVEAPTAGSMMLAGVLLKLGGYGMLRIALPLFPDVFFFLKPWIWTLSLVAIIVVSLITFVQTDMKKLIAYSSVGHMGIVTLGLYSGSVLATQGALFHMISHGLVSAALFFCIGILYERFQTLRISDYGVLVKYMRRFSAFFFFFTLANIGIPGTSGFIGEFLVIIGTFQISVICALLASMGMVFSASYGLWLYRRVIYDNPQGKTPSIVIVEHPKVNDISLREFLILGLLLCGVFFLGIYPKPLLTMIQPSIDKIVREGVQRQTGASLLSDEKGN